MEKRKVIAVMCALMLSASYMPSVSAAAVSNENIALFAADVSDASALSAAILAGGEYKLTADITAANSGINNQTATTGIIDGGGHTIKKADSKWGDAVLYQNNASSWTFKNLTIDGSKLQGTFTDAALWYMAGKVVFEDTVFQNFKTEKENRFTMTDNGADITLKNVEFKDNENTVQSVFEENPGVNIISGKLTLEGATKANVYYTGGTVDISGLTAGCDVHITADTTENYNKIAELSNNNSDVIKSINPITKTITFANDKSWFFVSGQKSVSDSGKTEVEGEIVNTCAETKSVDIIAASYTSDMMLKSLDIQSVELKSGTSDKYKFNLTAMADDDIFVYVWEKDSKEPLSLKTEIIKVYDENSDIICSYDFDNNVDELKSMLKGGAVIKENEGISDSALVLDGNSAYMQLPNDIITSEMTFMAWIKTDTDQSWARLFDFGSDSNNNFFYSPNGGRIESKISGKTDTFDTEKFNDTGIWVHYAVTRSPNAVQLYRNGVLVGEKACTYDISSLTQSSNYIGKSHYESDKLFCGAMDNIAVYKRICTGDEIKEEYDKYAQKLYSENAYKDYSGIMLDNHVSSQTLLPTTGDAGSTISWTASEDGILSEDMSIISPKAGEADKRVTLTAEVTNGDIRYKKTFDVTVLAQASITGISDYKMSDVEMTNEYLINGESMMAEYLKKFNIDKSTEGFKRTAGKATGVGTYGGWETSLIAGHAIGHYVSALAQGTEYSKATEVDEDLLAKSQQIIDALYDAQIKEDTTVNGKVVKKGYLFATTDPWSGGTVVSGEGQFDNVENGKTNITKEAWVPWYTMHKILAGLVDTYKFTGNERALEMASELGDWVYNRVGNYSSAMQAKVLNIEYGGMNDCLYELYKLTGKPEHAKAAHMFDEISLFDDLYEHKDVLANKHANTTIPKVIGGLNRYRTYLETNGKLSEDSQDSHELEYYLTMAENFWDIVVNDHSYITGGNSENEHFRNAHTENAYRNNINCETCNTYNMLKLSRELYKLTGDKKYVDYYESTFLNAIVSSQNPETGMTMYFQPMATGYFKVFSTEFDDFWCCTGSGMESFTKLTDSIYYKKDDKIIVNQYISSVLTDKENNIRLMQNSQLPNGETVSFKVESINGDVQKASIILRVPEWTADVPTVKINGEEVEYIQSGGFIEINREWDLGDTIELTLPMEIRAYSLADSDTVTAFKYGPTVLSVGLGKDDMTEKSHGMAVRVPKTKAEVNEYVIIDSNYGTREEWIDNLDKNMVKTDGKLEFTMQNTDQALVFTPHYKRYDERYGIYWYITGMDEVKQQKIILNDKLAGREENIIIDSIEPSHDQQENGHGYTQDKSVGVEGTGTMVNYRQISEGGYVDYQMVVDKTKKNYLTVTYSAEDSGRKMNIYAGGELLSKVTADGVNQTVKYEIPQSIIDKAYTADEDASTIAGKSALHIVFKAECGTDAPKICENVKIVTDYGTNPNLQSLEIDGGTLAPNFDSDVTEYTLTVDTAVKALKIKAIPNEKYGLVYINGVLINDTSVKEISANVDTIEIKVFAEDHQTQKAYTITVQ